jgi:hypothetical protein
MHKRDVHVTASLPATLCAKESYSQDKKKSETIPRRNWRGRFPHASRGRKSCFGSEADLTGIHGPDQHAQRQMTAEEKEGKESASHRIRMREAV